jgi:hypothetical protein
MQNFDILTPDNLPELRALLLDFIGDADYSRGSSLALSTAGNCERDLPAGCAT